MFPVLLKWFLTKLLHTKDLLRIIRKVIVPAIPSFTRFALGSEMQPHLSNSTVWQLSNTHLSGKAPAQSSGKNPQHYESQTADLWLFQKASHCRAHACWGRGGESEKSILMSSSFCLCIKHHLHMFLKYFQFIHIMDIPFYIEYKVFYCVSVFQGVQEHVCFERNRRNLLQYKDLQTTSPLQSCMHFLSNWIGVIDRGPLAGSKGFSSQIGELRRADVQGCHCIQHEKLFWKCNKKKRRKEKRSI